MRIQRSHQVIKAILLYRYILTLAYFYRNSCQEEEEVNKKTASGVLGQETGINSSDSSNPDVDCIREKQEISVGFVSEYSDSMNLYQGMNMNPWNYTDPFGLAIVRTEKKKIPVNFVLTSRRKGHDRGRLISAITYSVMKKTPFQGGFELFGTKGDSFTAWEMAKYIPTKAYTIYTYERRRLYKVIYECYDDEEKRKPGQDWTKWEEEKLEEFFVKYKITKDHKTMTNKYPVPTVKKRYFFEAPFVDEYSEVISTTKKSALKSAPKGQ